MSYEITDHVPGLTEAQVAGLVKEAEVGYDLSACPVVANPHFQRVQLVPEDLLEAIDERAAKDGQSPDAVVREALSNYLDTA
ncbi:ribbon-helix-helix domain-containing protein [Ornithinimicrobium cryptoxanthini]|uniref:Ribbon-helix-helix domain-containing protein n=1 Tax=Ornithinimicrobium cryptoxanthini TaxID=2934161 RepID=A0ABY4YGW9_9MICO|nr:ribbon-helix-helix domain-containing protein [Ornithinimicrobium cryptoxanthini]USQ76014.1 ribbon-helix-helix domain-containing protein [Ornithinimicrobium cryptoxanthini]